MEKLIFLPGIRNMFRDYFNYRRIVAAVATWIIVTSYSVASTNEANTQDKGIVELAKILYGQHKPAIPELREAAKTGDAEAQFYLGAALHDKSRYMTREAQYWYEQAAYQGDIYAMYRLARRGSDICTILNNCPATKGLPIDWPQKLRATASARAENGDGEAMFIMYHVTGKRKWLERADEAGHPESQWLLASVYQSGEGFFWPGRRREAVRQLLKRSAEGGFPKGIIRYAGNLLEAGKYEEATEWTLKGVAIGYWHAIYNYAYGLEGDDLNPMPIDPQKSYAMYSLLRELDGNGGLDLSVKNRMENLETRLTPLEIERALEYAEDWKKVHPPVSYHPTKLGILD